VTVAEMVRPRVSTVPDAITFDSGRQAVELVREHGLRLDAWQEHVLERSLGETENGTWAAFEVGVNVARQNGKDEILLAREIAGLFLLEEELIIHTAHLFKTAKEHFLRLVNLIRSQPALNERVARVSYRGGEEGIELRSGQRILFGTRGKSSFRGFSGDLVIYNEAMIISDASHGAMLPMLSAMPNPQVWYTGTAVDQLEHTDARVWTRIRARGHEGDSRLAYFEWSAAGDNPDHVNVNDEDGWLAANPALDVRITRDYVRGEAGALHPRKFAVERLGVGDWPPVAGDPSVIDPEAWAQLADPDSKLQDPVCFAYDVSRDRSSASIAAAGRNQHGQWHVELVDHRPSTGWIRDRLNELRDRHGPDRVVRDAYAELPDVDADPVNTVEHGQAFGLFIDQVGEQTVRHLADPKLTAAVRAAKTRTLGDAGFAWARKTSAVDISPLVAVTLALWAAAGEQGYDGDPVIY
jgi:phage terminase large subunit-like protein